MSQSQSQLLWQITGSASSPQLDAWQRGLLLHLLFQPITLILARRDGQTRRYLALTGCPMCHAEGCERICHRMLFEQLVRTTLPGVTLRPTTRLIPQASETQRYVATPHTDQARLLDPAVLEPWSEGRLILTVSRLQAKPQPIRVGALIALGGHGPPMPGTLRDYGWRTHRLAALLHRNAFERPLPEPAPMSSRTNPAMLHAMYHPATWGDATSPTAPECTFTSTEPTSLVAEEVGS